ncbi:MAG: hypothetical protein ACXQTJ_04545 [Candidatus Syntropharchaeales archaeon]
MVYRVQPEAVEIVAIVHGARLLREVEEIIFDRGP